MRATQEGCNQPRSQGPFSISQSRERTLGTKLVRHTNHSMSWKLKRVTCKMLSKITLEFMASTIKTGHLQLSAPLEVKSLPPMTNQRPFGKKRKELI